MKATSGGKKEIKSSKASSDSWYEKKKKKVATFSGPGSDKVEVTAGGCCVAVVEVPLG